MKKMLEYLSRNKWLPYACIATLAVLLYHKAVFFGFSYMDDNLLIIDNYDFLSNISNFLTAFTRDVFYPGHSPLAFYRPILTVSFMLDAHLWGASAMGYHITNILLHIAASCLLFVFLMKLEYKKAPSFIIAAIFAVHPVVSQAVAWIPGRNDTLLAVFVLASFVSLIDFSKTGKWAYCICHLLFFLLALLTKESALAVIPLGLLYCYAIAGKEKRPLDLKIIAAGWGIMLVFWFFLRAPAMLGSVKWTVFEATRSLYLLVPGFIQYIGKIVFPVNLSVAPIIRDTFLWPGYIATSLLIAILIRSFHSRNGRPALLLFGASWFILFLAPSLISPDLASLVSDFMEHRIYVPLIGFAVIALESGLARYIDQKNRTAITICVIVLITFSGATYLHIENFRDRVSFWENAAKTSPHSSTAHRLLGMMYEMGGAPDKAEKEYRTAIALEPQEPAVHYRLGRIYTANEKLADAEREYKKEIALRPLSDSAYTGLGALYYKQGKTAEAENMWRKAFEINPDNIEANKDLAIYYYERNDARRALYHVDRLQKMGVIVPREFLEKIRKLKE